VTRLVSDQLEQHQPKLPAFEHASRATSAPTAADRAFIAEVEVERAPIPLPAAASAHGHERFGQIDFEMAARAASMMPVSHPNLLSM
jgi:hypothetical protein